jgi:hypothetical protein
VVGSNAGRSPNTLVFIEFDSAGRIFELFPVLFINRKFRAFFKSSATALTLMFRQLERLQSLDLSHCPDLREVQTAAFHNNLDLRLVIKGGGNDTFITDFFN